MIALYGMYAILYCMGMLEQASPSSSIVDNSIHILQNSVGCRASIPSIFARSLSNINSPGKPLIADTGLNMMLFQQFVYIIYIQTKHLCQFFLTDPAAGDARWNM